MVNKCKPDIEAVSKANSTARLVSEPHAVAADDVVAQLDSTSLGLTGKAAETRLEQYGHNRLPRAQPLSLAVIFARPFISPLIYVLVAAAIFSLVIQEWSDAAFITGVLLINAIIGSIQEFSAQRAATALQQLVTTQSRVLRDGDTFEINAELLVPGDILLLESGERIPADVRLLSCHGLEVDESLLTGESAAVLKQADAILDVDTFVGDRRNMVFAGTMVNRGRGSGVVVTTALSTQLGSIAEEVIHGESAKAPWLSDVQPVSLEHWFALLGLALTVTVVMEIHKLYLLLCGRTNARYMCPSWCFVAMNTHTT